MMICLGVGVLNKVDKICSRCDNNARSGQRYCNACHAEYIRIWRRSHPLKPYQRRKMNCRSYANTYQKRGLIIPQPCSACGKKAEKHHEDYDKPLDIEWLCKECHLDLHKEKVARETIVS